MGVPCFRKQGRASTGSARTAVRFDARPLSPCCSAGKPGRQRLPQRLPGPASRPPCRHGRARARAARRRAIAVAAGTIRSVVETMLRIGQASAAGIDRSRRRRASGRRRAGRRANRSSNSSRAAAPATGGPSLAQSSSVTKVRASSPSRSAKASNLATVRAGSRLQKALCSTSIGSRPSAADGRPRLGPQPGELRARLVREAAEMPGRGDRREAARRPELGRRRPPSSRRGNSRPGRPARRATRSAAAGCCSTWPATDSVLRGPRRASPSRAAARGGRAPPASAAASGSPRSSTLGGLISEGTNSDRRARCRHNRAAPRPAPRRSPASAPAAAAARASW